MRTNQNFLWHKRYVN